MDGVVPGGGPGGRLACHWVTGTPPKQWERSQGSGRVHRPHPSVDSLTGTIVPQQILWVWGLEAGSQRYSHRNSARGHHREESAARRPPLVSPPVLERGDLASLALAQASDFLNPSGPVSGGPLLADPVPEAAIAEAEEEAPRADAPMPQAPASPSLEPQAEAIAETKVKAKEAAAKAAAVKEMIDDFIARVEREASAKAARRALQAGRPSSSAAPPESSAENLADPETPKPAAPVCGRHPPRQGGRAVRLPERRCLAFAKPEPAKDAGQNQASGPCHGGEQGLASPWG